MLPISVIIPVYNGETVLGRCLEAVLAESWQADSEIIVVDDGSTDASRQVVGRFAGVTLIGGESRGAAAAINLGLQRARHEIVAQIDQDVIISKGWASVLQRVLVAGGPRLAAVQAI